MLTMILIPEFFILFRKFIIFGCSKMSPPVSLIAFMLFSFDTCIMLSSSSSDKNVGLVLLL